MYQWVVRSWLAVMLVAAIPPVLVAQVTTGQISGTVHDSSGAIVPGAEVVVLNLGTGTTRTVKSEQDGHFDVPTLPIGDYQLVISAQGFKEEVHSGITLTVGLHVVVNSTLSAGAVSEKVTVSGGTPLVETNSSSVGAVVTREQMHDLPLNGRDYTQLALLQPGVVAYHEQSKELNRGMGTRFSISGARTNQVGFRLNGVDVGDATGNTPGSATGNNLGVDAIQEFQVLTNTFSAEYGKAAGGVVNIVHKSGTNAFRGGLFEYWRNSAMDARNFFDPEKAPPFNRNQFGGTLGGPLVQNRTFFFGAYEGLREDLSLTGINVVLSNAVRNGAFGPVSPLVKPYLDVMPAANGRDFGNGTAEYQTQVDTASREHYFVGKVDHAFSAKDSLSVSYTFDKGEISKPDPRDGIVTYATDSSNHYQYVTAQETHIFSSNLLNVVRGGINRSHTLSLLEPLMNFAPTLGFVPGVNFGQIQISGVDNFGLSFGPETDRELSLDSYQVADSLTWLKGAHSFKVGMEAYRFKVIHSTLGRSGGGLYTFDSIPLFLQAQASSFQSEDPSAPKRPIIHQNLFGFFAQDDIRLGARLTLNAGVRYEFITLPSSNGQNESSLVHLTDPKLTTSDTFFKNPSLKNVAPRGGLAWDVFGNQRTAVHGGIGLYHDELTSYYYLQTIENNPPFGLGRTLQSPPFPNGQALLASGSLPKVFDLTLLEYAPKQPVRVQYNVGLQQQMGKNMAVAVYFVGARGYNNTQFFLNANGRAPSGTTADGRLLFSKGSPPVNPNFGVIQYRTTTGDAWYKSVQFVLNRRPIGGLSYQASYTWQKNEDTGSAFSNSSEGLNTVAEQSIYESGPEFERGLSAFNLEHSFTLNANYDLPFQRNATGFVRALTSDWQLSGIFNLSSGHPFTPILGFDNANVLTRSKGDHLRPDLVPGGNANPVEPGNVDQYFDPRQFVLPPAGTLGNLGRDTIIGPGVAMMDASLKKRVRLGARTLELRAEVFNVLNHANFHIPEDTQRTVINKDGTYNANAGRITSTSTTSRQIQLAMRFEF